MITDTVGAAGIFVGLIVDQLLAERERINHRLRWVIDQQTGPGGSKCRRWR